ncbi:hypothetical protein BDZ91DRAFT_779151 [Kalaharituber pfeilii]|nr:hypothetical protein BDZ91DRAFT_779151 [Kalaharituber pfeilii]
MFCANPWEWSTNEISEVPKDKKMDGSDSNPQQSSRYVKIIRLEKDLGLLVSSSADLVEARMLIIHTERMVATKESKFQGCHRLLSLRAIAKLSYQCHSHNHPLGRPYSPQAPWVFPEAGPILIHAAPSPSHYCQEIPRALRTIDEDVTVQDLLEDEVAGGMRQRAEMRRGMGSAFWVMNQHGGNEAKGWLYCGEQDKKLEDCHIPEAGVLYSYLTMAFARAISTAGLRRDRGHNQHRECDADISAASLVGLRKGGYASLSAVKQSRDMGRDKDKSDKADIAVLLQLLTSSSITVPGNLAAKFSRIGSP